jgi:membrane-bound inhibitor of C-type lysozyme
MDLFSVRSHMPGLQRTGAGKARRLPACRKKASARFAVPTATLALALLAAGGAEASKLTIDLPGVAAPQTISAAYTCKGGAAFTVQYITAGSSALAVLPVNGQATIFAQGPSADGGRYVAGFFVWWSKGNTGSLFDVRKGDDAAPILTCTSK